MNKIILALAVVSSLAACAGTSRQTQNAAVGAGIGAGAAAILDEDVATGALIGGAAGLGCTEAGMC